MQASPVIFLGLFPQVTSDSPQLGASTASLNQVECALDQHQQSFESLAINRLRERGFRVTMPRIHVARVLDQATRPLTAYGVHEQVLAGGGRIDVVSVYRILATLSELGLVHHIGIVDGYIACRMEGEHSEEQEHVVCEKCGKVTELSVPPEAIDATRKQLKQIGIGTVSIKMEILGRCDKCAS